MTPQQGTLQRCERDAAKALSHLEVRERDEELREHNVTAAERDVASLRTQVGKPDSWSGTASIRRPPVFQTDYRPQFVTALAWANALFRDPARVHVAAMLQRAITP